MEKAVKLAAIEIEQKVAEAQAKVLAEAFKNANIELVGGEQAFINNVLNAVGRGKTVDRLINNSDTLTELKKGLLGNGSANGNGGMFSIVRNLIDQTGMKSEDVKNLTLASLLFELRSKVTGDDKSLVSEIMDTVSQLGMGDEKASKIL
jgi:phosphoribosylaminoimidazole (AIR) synthetase